MLEFSYDGKVKTITASEDCVVSFALKGGGGGGGGNDTGTGSSGTHGTFIGAQIALAKDTSVFVAVGGGGGGGISYTRGYGGGGGGLALDGFSGGTGGNAGPVGTSGSGGGGGGATVLYKMVNGSRVILAVAGGGAGGGGGGNKGYQDGYLLPNSQYTYFPDELPGALYYPTASTVWDYSTFLNTRGIWDYSKNVANFVWDVYLTAGNYEVDISADDYAELWIEGIPNAFNEVSPGTLSKIATPNGTADAWNSVHTKPMKVTTTGWYKVTIYAANYRGAGGCAFLIRKNGFVEVLSSRSPYNLRSVNAYTPGRGGKGQNHQGDGGGPGGGGGGYPAGRGSDTPIDDVGAAGGTPGYSYKNYAAGVADGYWTGASANARYYGLGAGAGTSGDGTGGYAAVASSFNNSISVKSGTKWVKPSEIYIKRNGSWVSPSVIYVKENGEWKTMYGETISHSADVNAVFNRVSGPPNPYPEAVYDTVVSEGGRTVTGGVDY